MKHGLKLAGMLTAMALYLPAHADDRLDGMKKMNSEGCVQAIEFEENAPKDPKQVKPYCTCVYDTYYNKFSKEEQNQMFSAPASDKLQKSMTARLQAAKAECRKKIGF